MRRHNHYLKKKKIVSLILLFAIAALGRTGGVVIDPSAGADPLTAAILKAADNAYEANMRGLDAIDKKNYAAAISSFDEALNIFPNYSDALNNKGVALYRQGNVGSAQRAWEAVVKMDPQYALAYYNIGLLFLHERKPEEAKKQFELALRHNKKFTEAIVRLGVMQMEAGNLAAAVDQFARAYKATPVHQDAWNFYSHGLILTGDTGRAVTVLRAAGENSAALSQLGRIEGVRGNHRASADYFSRAVRLGSTSALLLELALAQTNAGSCKEALSTLSDYFSKEKTPSVDSWLLAGFAANACEGVSKALEYYQRGLRQYPNDQLLRANAAQIYFNQKNYEQAQKLWDGLVESLTEPSVFYKRAIAARALNDLPGAERFIQRAISMDEKAEYHDFLGVLYHTRGNGARAEEHFRKALKLDPNNASAQLNLAMKSSNSADLTAAVAEASKQLASCKSKCADIALRLSVLYYHQRKTNDAISTLMSVREQDRNIAVYRHLAIYYKEQRDYEKAFSALETAASRFTLDPKTEYELAEIYLTAGKPDKAVKLFTALLPKWKENLWRLHYQLGYAYMEMNDLQMAKASFEKSLSIRSDNPASRGLLAFVLNRMGETEKARAHWEKNVKEDPNNPVIFINLGLSHENKGEYEKALENYRKALSLKPSEKAVNINMGNAYQALNKIPEALTAYNLALESEKRQEAAWSIFLLARKRNDMERAQRMHAILRKEFPSSVYCARASAEMDLLKGDTAKALISFEAIKEKDAHDWHMLSKIYAGRGDNQKTQNALSKLPSGGEWEYEKKLIRAQLAFRSSDFRNAFSLYKEIINTQQGAKGLFAAEDMDIYMYNMVLSAHNAGMHKEAVETSNDIIKKVHGKNRTEILRVAANSSLAIKDWNNVKKWFDLIVTQEPRNAAAQFNLAAAHYNLGEIEAAYERYQRARAIDKTIKNNDIENRYAQFKSGVSPTTQKEVKQPAVNDTLDKWYNEAVDLHNSKKEAQAEKLYKKILERDPSYSLAWNNLGAIYGARGELEQARDAYMKALENSGSPETYANLVNIFIALEDAAQARAFVKKGLTDNPGSRTLVRLEKQVGSMK
ncbi:MAG: tetratricopeptide repeat protein [Chitinispirillales bacterium]|jgi:tetratricopeptide (TPR) repeat protein|nr:tetratricopeptide repeat protein [Chitinispirillales bacterium]